MTFAIKAEVSNPQAKTFAFKAQKTMYRGKHIAKGDTVFIFANENEGGKVLSCVSLSFLAAHQCDPYLKAPAFTLMFSLPFLFFYLFMLVLSCFPIAITNNP